MTVRSRLALLLPASALVLLAGCGDGRIPTYPVSGSVLVDGKPAEGAILIFVPEMTSEEAERERPFGMADAQGKFSLTTFEKGDGAPAGEYKVLVHWPAQSNQSDQARAGGRGSLGPDRLRGKYFILEKTNLVATVEERATDLPPFELQAR